MILIEPLLFVDKKNLIWTTHEFLIKKFVLLQK